jgi:outer membrane protein OmpA-like peptidoglycan-associated protein
MDMKRNWATWLVKCAALLAAAGCATVPDNLPPPPQSYVVLLSSADGTAGQLSVRSVAGEAVLNQPRHGVNLDGSNGAPYAVGEGRIDRDFGEVLAVQTVLPLSFMFYYEPGGTRLRADSQALIARVIDAARSRPFPDVSIIGHTDVGGDAKANEKLGLQRARSIAELIKKAGFKAHDLTIASHSGKNPLFRTPGNKPEPKNHRVEFTVR